MGEQLLCLSPGGAREEFWLEEALRNDHDVAVNEGQILVLPPALQDLVQVHHERFLTSVRASPE
jgi:hypothetical protein